MRFGPIVLVRVPDLCSIQFMEIEGVTYQCLALARSEDARGGPSRPCVPDLRHVNHELTFLAMHTGWCDLL